MTSNLAPIPWQFPSRKLRILRNPIPWSKQSAGHVQVWCWSFQAPSLGCLSYHHVDPYALLFIYFTSFSHVQLLASFCLEQLLDTSLTRHAWIAVVGTSNSDRNYWAKFKWDAIWSAIAAFMASRDFSRFLWYEIRYRLKKEALGQGNAWASCPKATDWLARLRV